MDDHAFDTLSKALAAGFSRRWVVGVFAAGLGTVVGQRQATHAKGNNECVALCKSRFGPGKKRDQCISAGARGEGPCAEAGGPVGGTHPDLELGESACGIGTVCNLEHSCFDENNCVCMRRVDGTAVCTARRFIQQPCVSDLQCDRRGYTGFHCVLSACLNPNQERFATACAEPCIRRA